MRKILMKDKEAYFINSIYDLDQVVDEDTYDMICELIEDERYEQCETCSYCDPNDIDNYEEEYYKCRSVLDDVYTLLKDILKIDKLDDDMKENIAKVINDVIWALH